MTFIKGDLVLWGLFCTTWAATIFRAPCRDDLTESECLKIKQERRCTQNREEMKLKCRKSCGFCRTCQDNLVKWKCLQLKRVYSCQTDAKRMKIFCPETCGFCPRHCADIYDDCPDLMLRGFCKKSPGPMRNSCGESCGYCTARTPCDDYKCPSNHKCTLTRNMKPKCVCQSYCSKTDLTGPLCTKNGTTYPSLCALRKEECRLKKRFEVQYYGKCSNVHRCMDAVREAKYCGVWKSYGACHVHSKIMEFYCPKTCGLCRQPAPGTDCADLPHGCCWDSGKAVVKQVGKGCRACRDSKFCSLFAGHCGSPVNKKFMKEFCPSTCGYCISKEGENVYRDNKGFQLRSFKFIKNNLG